MQQTLKSDKGKIKKIYTNQYFLLQEFLFCSDENSHFARGLMYVKGVTKSEIFPPRLQAVGILASMGSYMIYDNIHHYLRHV